MANVVKISNTGVGGFFRNHKEWAVQQLVSYLTLKLPCIISGQLR